MPRFVLIEHSLESVGTHCYENAVRVLNAAERAGYEPVLATHQSFRAHSLLPDHWQVLPLFRYTFLGKYSLFPGSFSRAADSSAQVDELVKDLTATRGCASGGSRSNRRRSRHSTGTIAGPWARLRFTLGRRRRARAFSRACADLFRSVPLEAGDHVFLPTMFDLDVMGLADWLRSQPRTRLPVWHLYFHTNFLWGRPPHYADQEFAQLAMRRALISLQSTMVTHDVRCYTTTHELAAQYNRLGLMDFQTLAYPVESVHPCGSSGSDELRFSPPAEPLRIVCAGHLRPEKGAPILKALIDDLWDEFLASGRVQLQIQARDPSAVPEHTGARAARTSDAGGSVEPIVCVQHPLPTPEYLEFLRRAHIGWLPYDSEAYYARLSSVFVELLAAGKPVLVPAACWMAEQVAIQNYEHLDRLSTQLPLVARRKIENGTSVSIFDRPEGASELLVRFDWSGAAQPGEYVRWRCEQLDRDSHAVIESTATVGQRGTQSVPVLFHLDREPRIRVSYEDAFGTQNLPLENIELRLLGSLGTRSPAGSIGLIFDEGRMLPQLLRELVAHYAHYRDRAEAHAVGWRQRHDVATLIRRLTR